MCYSISYTVYRERSELQLAPRVGGTSGFPRIIKWFRIAGRQDARKQVRTSATTSDAQLYALHTLSLSKEFYVFVPHSVSSVPSAQSYLRLHSSDFAMHEPSPHMNSSEEHRDGFCNLDVLSAKGCLPNSTYMCGRRQWLRLGFCTPVVFCVLLAARVAVRLKKQHVNLSLSRIRSCNMRAFLISSWRSALIERGNK